MSTLTIVAKYWKVGAIVVLVGALMFACHARDEALKAEGAAKEQLLSLTRKLRVDSLRAATQDSVVRVDTLRLVQFTRQYDTVRRVVKITDTISVKSFITIADSTIGACRQAVSSLTLSCAAKDTIIATQRAMLAVRTAIKPVTRPYSFGVSGGYGATLSGGRIVTGPSVSVGVQWHPF